jgi:hypothetical protein
MIRFSYSNEDIKDEGEEEGLMAAWAHRLDAAPRAEPATTLNARCVTPKFAQWAFHLATSGHNVEPRHNIS